MSFTTVSEQKVQLRDQWVGFDLNRMSRTEVPTCFRRGDIILVSGCITTVNPQKLKAGFDIAVGWVDCRPQESQLHVAPTMMSRYEGIYQCGTHCCFTDRGELQIRFRKLMTPMVLHLSGLCCLDSRDDDKVELPIGKDEVTEFFMQGKNLRKDNDAENKESKKKNKNASREDIFVANPENKPSVRCCNGFAFLSGEIMFTKFGMLARQVTTLPEGYRPRRDLRWLGKLIEIKEEDGSSMIDQSVAITLRRDGTITVQGGYKHAFDNKGNMRIVHQKKDGILTFDGIRFALMDGFPIQTAPWIKVKAQVAPTNGKAKLSYLVGGSKDADNVPVAACIKQGDVVMLEGYLEWDASANVNTKQALAVLPNACWPRRREVFFTRGGSDMEERRRVDVDRFGRIFCPEGAADFRVELTGIIFVAAPHSEEVKPQNPEWDELKLHYDRGVENKLATSFDGHDLLEHYIQRCNYEEWRLFEYDITRHTNRKMLVPLGEAKLRGDFKWDKSDLGSQTSSLWWRELKDPLKKKFKITNFRTLLHMSQKMFDHVMHACNVRGEYRRHLVQMRQHNWMTWMACQRENTVTFEHLDSVSDDIVEEMCQHWDFKAQIQGALQNDFKAPSSIEHLFKQRGGGANEKLIRDNISADEMAKFEEIRQFFFLYETTGTTMTHCSLLGSTDIFTATGKWHFPDSKEVQKELFEKIAWLFPRKMYLYISERQTARFPFIEDLDIQCKVDWKEWKLHEKPYPPDELIMSKPVRNERGEVSGECGELMERRAIAIHKIFSGIDKLHCLVYSASGYNRGKDLLKSSFHLVWPQLIVDADRAPVLRHVTLGMFERESKKRGSKLSILENRLKGLDQSNEWQLVFDQTTINARNGLRLPYSDKASMKVAPDQKPLVEAGLLSKGQARHIRLKEGRPSIAIGELVFEFERDPITGEDQLVSSKWVADEESKPVSQWIAEGTCRRDPNNAPDLTPWHLSQEVLEWLPKKAGEKFYLAENDDGDGQGWQTHKPFPNIRRCVPPLPVKEFKERFDEHLRGEQDQIHLTGDLKLLGQLIGSWVHLTQEQAIWRTNSHAQIGAAKIPDFVWAKDKKQIEMYSQGLEAPAAPTEVVYFAKTGKMIVTGPSTQETVDAVIRVLSFKDFTKKDNNAIMPLYDITQMN